MALKISTLQVIHKLLSSRLSTADTPTSQWKQLSRPLTAHQPLLPQQPAEQSLFQETVIYSQKCYLRCDQDATNGVLGDALITDVTPKSVVSKSTNTREWLVWAELTTPESKAAGYKYLTGGFQNTLAAVGAETLQQSVMVPLQFYFCRNPGLALPLIALQYHEVKMKFNFNTSTAVGRSGASTPTVEVLVDYIYFDTEERRRFAGITRIPH